MTDEGFASKADEEVRCSLFSPSAELVLTKRSCRVLPFLPLLISSFPPTLYLPVPILPFPHSQFDTSIRSRPGGSYFGLRSIDALDRLAKEAGWQLEEKIPMPKGNWVLVFGRADA
jgi:hypothetical protein